MTWLGKVAPWILTVIATAAAVGVLVWALNSRRSLAGDLARSKEAAELLAKGLRVAHESTKAELAAKIAESQALAAQVAGLLAAAPGSTPVATAHGSTGSFVVGSPVAVTPTQPIPPAGGGPSPPGDVPTPARPCLVYAGDRMEIVASGAALRTPAGNIVVTATARLNWISPTTGELVTLMDAVPLNLDVGILKQPDPPGWGLGPLAGAFTTATGGGWYVGGLVATPPVRLLFGLDGSAVAGGGGGPNGVATGWLAALVRW
jgi:hypothetical protein